MNFSQTVIGMFATTKRFWSTMLITDKYVLYMRLFIFAFGGGGGVWCNLVYPPGLKRRMNFSLTVIGLHVCYNQEILVNTAADHRQRCVIYETVYFCIGGGGGVQFSVPS